MISELKRFSADFEAMHGYCLEFMPLAVTALISEAQQTGQSIHEICNNKFSNFKEGLNQINLNTSQTVFKVGRLTVDNPAEELKNWVARSTEIASLYKK